MRHGHKCNYKETAGENLSRCFRRVSRTEVLNWDGTDNTELAQHYLTTTSTYMLGDQITLVRQTRCHSVNQDTTMSYDGYGRVLTRHVP